MRSEAWSIQTFLIDISTPTWRVLTTHFSDNTMNRADCQEAGRKCHVNDWNRRYLVRVAIGKDTQEGAQDDLKVEPQGPVFDVPQVILGPLCNGSIAA